MTNKVFTDYVTPIDAAWLNDVNGATYLGTGVNVPAGGVSSTTQQAAINELDTKKAPLASPALTGTPTAPTAAPGTNTTQVATTAYAIAADAVITAATVAKTASTGSAVLPASTTANRDVSPQVGYLRYNTSLLQFEGYGSAGWGKVGGGTSGGGTDAAFYQNDSVVTTAYNIGQDAQISGATFTNGVATIGMTAHGYVAGSQVCFTTTGSLPTNFAIGTKYHVIATGLTADQLQVSATYGGAAIVAGSAGSGTHSMGKIKNATMAGPITFLAAVGSTGGRLVVI
jgi:hypothetical protein